VPRDLPTRPVRRVTDACVLPLSFTVPVLRSYCDFAYARIYLTTVIPARSLTADTLLPVLLRTFTRSYRYVYGVGCTFCLLLPHTYFTAVTSTFTRGHVDYVAVYLLRSTQHLRDVTPPLLRC